MKKKRDWSKLNLENIKKKAYEFKLRVIRGRNWLRYIAWGRLRLTLFRFGSNLSRSDYRSYVYRVGVVSLAIAIALWAIYSFLWDDVNEHAQDMSKVQSAKQQLVQKIEQSDLYAPTFTRTLKQVQSFVAAVTDPYLNLPYAQASWDKATGLIRVEEQLISPKTIAMYLAFLMQIIEKKGYWNDLLQEDDYLLVWATAQLRQALKSLLEIQEFGLNGCLPDFLLSKEHELEPQEVVSFLDNAYLTWVLSALVGQFQDKEEELYASIERDAQLFLERQSYRLFVHDQGFWRFLDYNFEHGVAQDVPGKTNAQWVKRSLHKEVLGPLWLALNGEFPAQKMEELILGMDSLTILYEMSDKKIIDLPLLEYGSNQELSVLPLLLPLQSLPVMGLIVNMQAALADQAYRKRWPGWSGTGFDRAGQKTHAGLKMAAYNQQELSDEKSAIPLETCLSQVVVPEESSAWAFQVLSRKDFRTPWGPLPALFESGEGVVWDVAEQMMIALSLCGGIAEDVEAYMKTRKDFIYMKQRFDYLWHKIYDKTVDQKMDHEIHVYHRPFPQPKIEEQVLLAPSGTYRIPYFDLLGHLQNKPETLLKGALCEMKKPWINPVEYQNLLVRYCNLSKQVLRARLSFFRNKTSLGVVEVGPFEPLQDQSETQASVSRWKTLEAPLGLLKRFSGEPLSHMRWEWVDESGVIIQPKELENRFFIQDLRLEQNGQTQRAMQDKKNELLEQKGPKDGGIDVHILNVEPLNRVQEGMALNSGSALYWDCQNAQTMPKEIGLRAKFFVKKEDSWSTLGVTLHAGFWGETPRYYRLILKNEQGVVLDQWAVHIARLDADEQSFAGVRLFLPLRTELEIYKNYQLELKSMGELEKSNDLSVLVTDIRLYGSFDHEQAALAWSPLAIWDWQAQRAENFLEDITLSGQGEAQVNFESGKLCVQSDINKYGQLNVEFWPDVYVEQAILEIEFDNPEQFQFSFRFGLYEGEDLLIERSVRQFSGERSNVQRVALPASMINRHMTRMTISHVYGNVCLSALRLKYD